ncbi:MAG: hypothetical protein QOE35_632 [Actinomycetota bacterium]
MLTAAAAGAAPARADDFVLGSGSGIATGVRVGPQTGGLTIAVTFGQALADFQGRVGRASARSVDFGILATALTAPGCGGKPGSFKQSDFPQPLDADSRDPASLQGKTAQQGGTPDGPLFATVGRTEVKADPTPFSHARSTIAGFTLQGVLSVTGGVADVATRIVKDQTREVIGTVDISSLDLLAGAIHLDGLHWEAVHRTGKDASSEGAFSVSSLSLNGVKVPASVGSTEASTVLAPVNALLLGTGLSLDPPVLDTSGGAADLTPMRIRIDHSPLGQAVVAPLVTAAQPVRQPLLDFYSGVVSCDAPVGQVQGVGQVGRGAVLPSDIALSALTGTGGFVIELGGVRATTEGQTFANPFEGGLPSAGLGSDLGLGPTDGTAPFSVGDVGSGAAPTSSVTGRTGGGSAATVLAGRTVADSVPGAKGGAAATVGVIALLGILSVAVADYLRMQRGQRVIPEVE